MITSARFEIDLSKLKFVDLNECEQFIPVLRAFIQATTEGKVDLRLVQCGESE